MWKGLKNVLGHRAKAQKTGAADVSIRSTSSAGQSSHGALFALELAEVDAMITNSQQGDQQQQQQQQQQQLPGTNATLTWAQLQQQLHQQHLVQQLMPQGEDSMSKRRAAAMQKRVANSMLNPSTCLYQISALLSLSTLFEHKLQRDTLQALQQLPSNLVSSLAAAQQQQQAKTATSQQQQQQPLCSSESGDNTAGSGVCCLYCQGDGAPGSYCSCQAGGPASLRTPSATAASSAHVALQLASWGYRVIVRKVLHSKAYWTKSMDNTFIVALDSSSANHVEYIVDPHFQEAFNVGVMSDNYRAVWQSLPRVFVGMPCQLQSAVQLLCEEMELSFLEAGRPCPPWRGWAATINRWMSDQFVDILVPEPSAPSEEVAEFMARCTQLNAVAVGPGSSTSGTSSSTRSSAALSTCSPPTGNVSQQRLGDKVHISSVLSSVSGAKERRVPEPLQKQLGFDADAPEQQQQQQQAAASCSSSAAAARDYGSSGACTALTDGTAQQQQQQQSRRQELLADNVQQLCAQDAVLDRRSAGSSTSTSSCASTVSSRGGSGRSSSGSSRHSKSLLTAQMQFKQLLELEQQPQHTRAAAAQQSWLQQQQQQLLLLQQQQQQKLLLQQAALQQQPQAEQHTQLQQHMQLLLLQQAQLQQQAATLGGCPLLPVVHTVRPCGAAAAAGTAGAAAAMHAAAMQQLVPLQQRHQVVQQAEHQQQVPHAQQQQQLQLQPCMHGRTEGQPKLLRLLSRPKPS